MSAKAKAKAAVLGPKRKAYVAEMQRCAVFPSEPASEVHEICGGADRTKAVDDSGF